ncbi:MAG TPA: efflux RND transporter permease subunit, partial [Gammaproteobacteria bacterium]|nr:efflux RND transporter permease subunit [Gammaproteobacteria bacterium]
MINRLVQFALTNRVLVFAALLAVLIGGGWTVASLPRDAYPDVTPPMVRIFTVSPGLSPVDVEKRISYPVSIAMYGLPRLDRIQSTSVFGLSRVTVYFKDGTDVYFARRLVMERLQVARQEIPEALGVPQLGPITTALGRVLMYTVENEPGYDYSLMERRTAQDWLVGRRLRTVPNVTDVLSIGGFV